MPETVRYNGSACLNMRSITSACRVMSERSDAPLTWADLSNVLWFVETCVTSKALFFDGTVPKANVDDALGEVETFKRANDLRGFDVHAIAFDEPAETLKAAAAALGESWLLIDKFVLDPTADEPLPENEHATFVEELRRVCALPHRERHDRALELVADAFRGSKCLAAMIENGDEALRAAQAIYNRHPGQEPLVTAALINRFRLNYVNQLASHKKSAYVPNPKFETLTQAHVRLFKNYLLEKVLAKTEKDAVKDGEANVFVENMKADAPLPPIGLYALLVTRAAARRPAAILETAYNEFRADTTLMRLLWRTTQGGIALRNAPDAAREIDDYFLDHYAELDRAVRGLKVAPRRKTRTYLIPAILKGLVKAIPETIPIVREGWKIAYSVLREAGSEFSVSFLGDRLLELGCDSYISGYQNLVYDFTDDERAKTTLAAVAERVERIFGRKLLPPDN